jgi:hypothetical protein
MINLLAIVRVADSALGSFLRGKTRAVQANTSLDKASPQRAFNGIAKCSKDALELSTGIT